MLKRKLLNLCNRPEIRGDFFFLRKTEDTNFCICKKRGDKKNPKLIRESEKGLKALCLGKRQRGPMPNKMLRQKKGEDQRWCPTWRSHL